MNYEPEKIVRQWATTHGSVPFTSLECFDQIKDLDDLKVVSDALGRLYRKRLLARCRVDGLRFRYLWHTYAGKHAGYELHDAVQEKVATVSIPIPPAPEVPVFLRKDQPVPKPGKKGGRKPRADHVANSGNMPGHDHIVDIKHTFAQRPDPAAIADAILAGLQPLLGRLAAFKREAEANGATVRVSIEKCEIILEGL